MKLHSSCNLASPLLSMLRGTSWLLLLLLLHQPESTWAVSKNLTVGVILPQDNRYMWSLPKTRFAVEFAINTVKQRNLLPGWTVNVDYRDSNCSETLGPLQAIRLFYNQQRPLVFLGPACDFALAPVARFTKYWGVPVMTSGALVKAFGDKSQYGLLTRLLGPYTKAGDFFVQIFRRFGWRTAGFLYHDAGGRDRSGCYFVVDALLTVIRRYSGQVPWWARLDDNNRDYLKILQEARLHTRIVIMCAPADTVREIMIAAHTLHYDLGDFVFFNTQLFQTELMENTTAWYRFGDTWQRNSDAKEAFKALMTVALKKTWSSDYPQFAQEVKTKANQRHQHTYGNEEVNSFVGAFHDAVILYALALNESLEAGIPITNGSEITQRMWNRTFRGITGIVSIDANGDRDAQYDLLDYDKTTGRPNHVGVYIGKDERFVLKEKIHWPGDRPYPPTDTPQCGFDDSRCTEEMFPEYVLVHIILALIFLVALLGAFFAFRHIRAGADLIEMNWRIPLEDVIFPTGRRRFDRSDEDQAHGGEVPERTQYLSPAGGMHHMMTSSNSLCGSMISSEGHLSTIHADNTIKTPPMAIYKSTRVVVMELVESTVNVSRPMLQEIRNLKELHARDHIVKFVGVCIDPPAPFMLTEFCSKGSLKGVLENENLRLDWTFRLSIMQDIIEGLAYLHASALGSHGNLKSTNCVVDGRFVIKITGFDLQYLGLHHPEDREERNTAWYQRQLWTAPELLRQEPREIGGSKEGDIYSLAIICQEIVYRKGVFYLPDRHLTQEQTYEQVKAGRKPVLRPVLDVLGLQPEDLSQRLARHLEAIVKRSWDETPANRPDAHYLRTIIKSFPQHMGNKGGLMDTMLFRLEQYAHNLEDMVAVKTREYLEEKQKAQDLLYAMLPESVAQCLIRGQSVVAETFESVTIYFSDICGFTALSAESTPMQVVELLNDLYTMFDFILEHYDVYKVETIGDAYMVVSGLPKLNGNLHAHNIARMSLDLRRNVCSFTIRHRPNKKLKIRIGVHSGSVVAGVVGLKMPRYCLFGDTVNTASRMESNGLPLKIHISQQTKDILDEFGTFLIKLRGKMEMKGKGVQTTYWLEGENKSSRQHCHPQLEKAEL